MVHAIGAKVGADLAVKPFALGGFSSRILERDSGSCMVYKR